MTDDKSIENNININNENELNLKEIILEQLTKLGTERSWVWKFFLILAIPNILNGFHVSSYVFIGQMPSDYWCTIPDLIEANWTVEQMRTISSTGSDLSSGCNILNWNYNELSKMQYDDAILYTQSNPRPAQITCLSNSNFYFHYEQPDGVSIVPEWDLVCEYSFWRTTVQVMVSFGKFLGAAIIGILSDKYGRKTGVTLGAILFIFGSIVTTVSPWYWLFLIGRFTLGSASSGLFYPGITSLSENISTGYRSWMSIVYTMSYPIGMIILAMFANFIHQWRFLQLALTIPSFFLIISCYFLVESPRWLVTKGRYKKACKIVFKNKDEYERFRIVDTDKHSKETQEKNKESGGHFCKNIFNEIIKVYGSRKYRLMAIMCHFMWCITSLTYYVTALNADNLSANRVIYVACTGAVDILSYIAASLILKFMGRKYSSFTLFALTGICLLLLIAIPIDLTAWIVFVAMVGRFGISAAYAVLTLRTAEIFPTYIRSTVIGISSTWSHVGSIAAPYIVDFLGQVAWFIPSTICGVCIVIVSILTLILPETKQGLLEDIGNDNADENTNKR